MIEKMKEQFTKYEVARILGARALQLAMDAPILINISKEKLEEINYDVLKISEIELQEGVLPITVKRPFPEKKEEKIRKMSKEEIKKIEEKKKKESGEEEDKEIAEKEEIEEQEIKEEGEIMELAKPDDEIEEEGTAESEE